MVERHQHRAHGERTRHGELREDNAGNGVGHGHDLLDGAAEDHEALITGDAIHSTAQCWHPEWHFIYDGDAERAVESRRHLLELAAEKACTVLGSHFTLPSIGRVRNHKEAFRWED